ncbi:MAG: DUF6567 family protein [Bacteroidota bacterium]
MNKITLLIVVLCSSCTAYHHGTLTESDHSNKDLNVIDLARGYAKVSRFLFFGGNQTDALIADARRSLLINYPLDKGQYFSNYTLDRKETYAFPGIHTTTVIITAEVVAAADSDFLTQLQEEANAAYLRFLLGQQVSFFDDKIDKLVEGEILALKKSKAVVGYVDLAGKFKIKGISLKKLKSAE